MGIRSLHGSPHNGCLRTALVGTTYKWAGVRMKYECICAHRMWREHEHELMTHDGEWGLGDLAYGGCGRMLVGRKHPTFANQRAFTRYDAYWNDLIAHYRSRVERVVCRVKSHAWCLGQPFRGSYALLVQFMEVTVLTTALEIRTEFEEERRPVFEVVGPWDHIF